MSEKTSKETSKSNLGSVNVAPQFFGHVNIQAENIHIGAGEQQQHQGSPTSETFQNLDEKREVAEVSV